MFRSIFFIIAAFIWFFFATIVPHTFALSSYTPPENVSMTGANGEVFFDVADDIYNSGSTVTRPVLVTATKSFSGAFYLSGAGWVDFSTGSYRVSLECSQTLDALSSQCTLSGSAYSEMIGDIVFGNQVFFDPSTSLLSGSVSTYLGEYDFSGIVLPLFPMRFVEGQIITADHQKNLTLSGIAFHSGPGTWRIHFLPLSGVDTSYTGGPYDLSHAGIYRVEIIDPDDGSTVIDDFRVTSSLPSSTLDVALPLTLQQAFCTTTPTACPDASSTLEPTTFVKVGNSIVANGSDAYSFTLKLRDRYGNAIDTGTVQVIYHDSLREIQESEVSPYASWGSGYAIKTTGDLQNFYDGVPSTAVISPPFSPVSYSIASIAPTSATDTLALSGILYTDALGNITDIADTSWKTPLSFDPWYTTSLSAGPMTVGSTVEFTTNYSHVTPAPAPTSPTAIYDIVIGSNMISSFQNFVSPSTISCVKYAGDVGANECSWLPNSYDPVIISTEGGSFSGLYSNGGYNPPPEVVNYRSYITYEAGGTRVLYPSTAGSLGTSIPGIVRMKIFGQQNLPSISGIEKENIAEVWNTLHKKITLLSRNRTSFHDVAYSGTTGDISLSDSDFTSTPEKRMIYTVGGDITLTSDIPLSGHPIAIIALSDIEGNGGNIHIDPSVKDIHATLFAEHSVFSTGADQLYIHGSVISHNTTSDSVCPYYVSPCVNPPLYNLENMRSGFLTSPGGLSVSLAGKYTTIPLVIEYDSRILSDPPPAFEK